VEKCVAGNGGHRRRRRQRPLTPTVTPNGEVRACFGSLVGRHYLWLAAAWVWRCMARARRPRCMELKRKSW